MQYGLRTALMHEEQDFHADREGKLKYGYAPGVGYSAIPDFTKIGSHSPCNFVLDCIAGATEEGYLTAENYLENVFKKKNDWNKFLDDLAEYEYWLNERHAYAFATLLECSPDEFITYDGLAGELRGQLD